MEREPPKSSDPLAEPRPLAPPHLPEPLDVLLLVLATLLLRLLRPAFLAHLRSPWDNLSTQLIVLLAPALFFLLAGRFELKAALPLKAPTARGLLGGAALGLSLWLPAVSMLYLVRALF